MKYKTIYVLSDSTGETAERVVRAALLQFPEGNARVRMATRVRDEKGIVDVLKRASEKGSIVVFTLVRPELRKVFHRLAAEYGVESADVIGSVIDKVGVYLGADPLNIPSAQMPLTEDYFRRVEAIEFAVKSDDGKEPRNLDKADLVLVGVSRTSKTPLSHYLAGRGLKVANVPLVLGVEPPKELFDVKDYKVIGLTIAIEQLMGIRQHRLQKLGMPGDANYGMREHVKAELEHAHEIFRRNPSWLVVDVTNCAIEETATIILESLKEQEERTGLTIPPPRVM